MNKHFNFKITGFAAMFLLFTGFVFFSPVNSLACGWGNVGGSDYVPQRQGGYAAAPAPAAQPAVGSDQAKTIVSEHVTKLNPDLMVGNVNDSGGFFEVEVLDKNNEVIQLLGVDKYSGRLVLLN